MEQNINNLQYNVAQLLKETIGSLREIEVESAGLDLDGIQSGVIRGKVKLTRTDRSILAQARFRSSVVMECSRCLKELMCPLNINLEEEYFPTINILNGRPVVPPDDPWVFTLDENHILDLTEAVRQYLLLALPMKPLCRVDCAGLCPKCGQDLNRRACGCHIAQPDPRWAVLAQLVSAKGAEK
jgi:uncharacterized protein